MHMLRTALCLILATLMVLVGTAFAEEGEAQPTLQPSETSEVTEVAVPEPTEPEVSEPTAQTVYVQNQTISVEAPLSVGVVNMNDAPRFAAGLQNKSESYHPGAVLISGALFAPANTDIEYIEVEVAGKKVYVDTVYRFPSDYYPSMLSEQNVISDSSREGFAFLADMTTAELPDGEVEIIVRLHAFGVQIELTGTRRINAAYPRYADVTQALRGVYIAPESTGEQVTTFQQTLQELGYLTSAQISGVYDEKTQEAMRFFCANNELDYDETGVSTETVYHMLTAKHNPKEDGIMGFLKDGLFVGDFLVRYWMLVAAAAFLIALIILIILLVKGRKKKKFDVSMPLVPSAIHTMSEEPSSDFSGNQEVVNILTTGDEPTVTLDDSSNAIIHEEDGETIDKPMGPGYTLMLRKVFGGKYQDQTIHLSEGGQAIIGRKKDAEIGTNPSDASVSHQHGVFRIVGGEAFYSDTSRNGTKIGNRVLRNEDSVKLPFDTMLTFEIGSHKIQAIVKKDNT